MKQIEHKGRTFDIEEDAGLIMITSEEYPLLFMAVLDQSQILPTIDFFISTRDEVSSK